jgi:type I restriction enzyme, S subunit
VLDYSFSIFVSLALIKPVNPYFFSEYAEAVMNSEIVFSQARERVTGIGTPDLHLIEIRDFRIPLPPLEEQKEIVKRVHKLLKLINYIQQQYQQTKGAINQLDQSILAQAFRGALVPQDPNDEPASVLLERIRALREKSTGATPKRSKKSTDTSPSQTEKSTGATKTLTNKSTPFKEAIQMELELE